MDDGEADPLLAEMKRKAKLRAKRTRELEGVVAHEMAHIKNRDILIASVAAMAAGAIAPLAPRCCLGRAGNSGDDVSRTK